MRRFAIPAVLVGFSIVLAMLASKALWGFCCIPPSIRFADHSIPERIAWFENAGVEGRDTRWSDKEVGQNVHIKAGLERCASDVHAFSDCTFARILVRNGASREWLSAGSLPAVEGESQLKVGLQCLRTVGMPDEAPYFGILGRATSSHGAHWAFISAETTNKNTHSTTEFRHVECAWPESGSGPSFVWRTYRYDVAGIEFLTPTVMAFCIGFVVLTLYGVARATHSVLKSGSTAKG